MLRDWLDAKNFDVHFKQLFTQFAKELVNTEIHIINKEIRIPLQGVQEPRKTQLIAAVTQFFKCLSSIIPEQRNNKLYIDSYMKSKLDKIFIDKLRDSIIIWQKKKIPKERAFIEGAAAGMFKEKLPLELGCHIGSFLELKEGVQMVRTCKLAWELAKEHETNTAPNLKSIVEKKLTESEMSKQLKELNELEKIEAGKAFNTFLAPNTPLDQLFFSPADDPKHKLGEIFTRVSKFTRS